VLGGCSVETRFIASLQREILLGLGEKFCTFARQNSAYKRGGKGT